MTIKIKNKRRKLNDSKWTVIASKLSEVLKDKWKSEYDKNPIEFLQKSAALAKKPVQARILKIENGAPIFYMVCVECKEEKQALPTFFSNHGGDYENLKSACKVCFARKTAERDATVDGWVRRLNSSYPKLRASDTTKYGVKNEGWFWERWRLQGGEFKVNENGEHIITKPALCAITFIALEIGGIHLPYCASINNKDVANKGRENHRSGDCELICAELNVSQQHEDIKDLKECWRQINESVDMAEADPEAAEKAKKEAIEAAKMNWANRKNKKANGVTAIHSTDQKAYNKQRNDLDLYTICKIASNTHRKDDIKSNRVMDGKESLTAEEIYELYIEDPCCAISKVVQTIKNGPKHFSVDRIDNSKGHIKGNFRLVCRMFNSAAGMTREKFLEMRAAWKAHC
jgi:hypothetical protein